MDYREKMYIKRIGKLVDEYLYEYVILPDDTRIYVNPAVFEEYIKTQPVQMWVPEFRNAYDTINLYRQSENDTETDNILGEVITALRCLAATYCPEFIAEMVIIDKTKTELPKRIVDISNLPKEFANDGARDLFEALVEVGYLNSEWQPTAGVKKSAKAYIAYNIAELLGINNVWKVFEAFWHLESMKQSYSQIENPDNNQKYSDIDKAIFSVVNKNQRLKETVKGKQILRKYKNQTM